MDDSLTPNLEQTEQQLRPLIENATDIITVLNADGTRRYVSPSIERLLGYTPEELIGKNVFEVVHPDDAAELRRLFTAGVTHPGIVITKQFRLKAKNGAWRIHEATAHNLLNDATVRGIVINSRDVTARKRLERRLTVQFEAARILSEAESLVDAGTQLLWAICDSLGWDLGQLWIVDREVDKLRWLTSWQVEGLNADDFVAASRARLFGSSAGLPGVIWAGRAPQWIDDITEDAGFTRSVMAAKADLHSMFGFPIKLGDEVLAVMEFFSRERQSLDESLLQLMTAIGTQIAQFIQRKRAETERSKLYEREQRARLELEATMHRMHQVQIVTEVALAHLSLDKLLTELLDRVRDAMDVDTVVILLLEEVDNTLVAWATKGLELDVGIRVPLGAGFAGRVAAQKEPIAIDELKDTDVHTPFLRERGVRSLLGVPLLIEGRVIGVIHVGRRTPRHFTDDDTRLLELVAFRIALAIDNARLFEEERAARREAEAASRAKDEFLTTISHELRTPLTPIIGWIHMIRNGLLAQKESLHGLAVIEKNSHALKRLINDLLDMSAILSGKMRMEQKSVRLDSAVREAVEMVRPNADIQGVRLEIVAGELGDTLVTGDRTRLVQAFSNLLDNAIKFSPAGALVKIGFDASGNTATVSVEDQGQGISSEFLPFVFERFRQEDGSKTRAHGGLGLGLALVKSFVEAHHGTIKAESAGQGLGSRFIITLPCNQVVAAAAAAPVEAYGESGPAHLMIIEDDLDTLDMLRATLEKHGYRVTACESADESLRLAPANSIDLVISDIGMPRMDGFEMIRRLREIQNYETVPAIALSGYATRKDVNAALAAGFDAHISKPVDPRELLKLIKKFVRKDHQ